MGTDFAWSALRARPEVLKREPLAPQTLLHKIWPPSDHFQLPEKGKPGRPETFFLPAAEPGVSARWRTGGPTPKTFDPSAFDDGPPEPKILLPPPPGPPFCCPAWLANRAAANGLNSHFLGL